MRYVFEFLTRLRCLEEESVDFLHRFLLSGLQCYFCLLMLFHVNSQVLELAVQLLHLFALLDVQCSDT